MSFVRDAFRNQNGAAITRAELRRCDEQHGFGGFAGARTAEGSGGKDQQHEEVE